MAALGCELGAQVAFAGDSDQCDRLGAARPTNRSGEGESRGIIAD
jgi:hypothetical protein